MTAGHPFALIGRTRDMTGISYVDMDFGDAVETSLEHLARLGHTCVALFNFPPDLLEAGYTSALIAREVFERRAADLGIRGIDIPCSHEPGEAFAVAARLLRSEPECTAAITTGWQFTGLLGALRAADLHVPDDFSIVSVIAAQFAEMLTPSLTGVEWPAFEAGRMAAEMLIERLTVPSAPPRQHLIAADLVVRESTGPAPRGRSAAGVRMRGTAREMKIVVTGGSGKAGRAIVRDLLEHGHEVLNVDRVPSPESSSPDSPAPFLLADLTDFGQTLEALSGGERCRGSRRSSISRRSRRRCTRRPTSSSARTPSRTHTVFSAAVRLGFGASSGPRARRRSASRSTSRRTTSPSTRSTRCARSRRTRSRRCSARRWRASSVAGAASPSSASASRT